MEPLEFDVSNDSFVHTTDRSGDSLRTESASVSVDNDSSSHSMFEMPQMADLNELSRRKSSRSAKT